MTGQGLAASDRIISLAALMVRNRDADRWSGRLAVAGLLLAALWIVGLLGLQTATESRVRRLLAGQQVMVERLMVGPVPVDPLTWDVVFKDGDRIRHGRYHWRGSDGLMIDSDSFAAAEDLDVWNELRASGRSPGFVHWARFPWLERDSGPDGERLYVMDGRYVRQRATGFGSAVFEASETSSEQSGLAQPDREGAGSE